MTLNTTQRQTPRRHPFDQRGMVCIGFAVAVIALFVMPHVIERKPVTVTAPWAPATGAEIPDSYFEKVRDRADRPCQRAIENLARYDLRWHWGRPFDRWNKYQRQDGVMSLAGDNADAQNGFGGWLRVNYECEFDPATNKVIDVRMNNGRLMR